MAILEEGQRHDGVQGHGYDKPKLGVHACARTSKKNEIYCRYLFPRKLRSFRAGAKRGVIEDDPYRPDLRNLFLERNDGLLNNFEEHLLLGNLGNIDWRPLLNLWAVLEYLTKYTAKAGKGSNTWERIETPGKSCPGTRRHLRDRGRYARSVAPHNHEIL